MQWWCSAGQGPWTWTPVLYPGVWIVVGLLALDYHLIVSRAHGTPRSHRWTGWAGVAIVYLALEWPLGPLAAGYLASAHAIQFLMLAFIAPPLILIGARVGIVDRWPTQGKRERVLRSLFNPLASAILFNIVVIATHVPRVNDTLMLSQLGAFAVDLAWLLSGIIFWWPLIVPVPSWPLFAVPLRMLYLFLGTLAHTGIAIVMLVNNHPMYEIYELAPRAIPMSAITDIKIAGTVMELVGAGIIFGVLTVMFFRWSGGTGAEIAPREIVDAPAIRK
jgi:putative membrane protein